ncbi:MAG TPA: HNH endonuclease signature motif containing protein [Bacteroidales bacterium]|nr:HNH endonuclease signature motif containing protein [Bacteroidales bacterium]
MENFELYIASPPKSNNSKKLSFKKNGERKYLMTFEIEEIKKLYPDKFNYELAKQFNVAESTILRLKRIHKLKKSEQIMDAKRFGTGHKPFNKGKNHNHCSSTKFQKGNIPKNHKSVGSKRITKDGYYEVKISEPNKWEALHRVIWMQQYGDIPKGMIVIFSDGNQLNPGIQNLEMISRSENMLRNQNRTKAAESMRKTWRIEKLRASYGLKRKTNLSIK